MRTKPKTLRGYLMPNLRGIREQKGISRKALATGTGLDYSFLWMVEKGTSGVGSVSADAIANYLQVPVAVLIENP